MWGLTFVMAMLKVWGAISLSWWGVTSPIWAPYLAVMCIILLLGALSAILWILALVARDLIEKFNIMLAWANDSLRSR